MLLCSFLIPSRHLELNLINKNVYSFFIIINRFVCVLCSLSCVQLFVAQWTIAQQAALSMEFSRQEYWSELPCPPPEDIPEPAIEPTSLVSPALAGGFFTTGATWEVTG